MFLPAELAREDMNTRLSLLAQKRFALGLSYSDSAGETLSIPAIHVGPSGSAQTQVLASPTHDGFYSVRLPIARDVSAIALQLGAVFEWFELAGITAAPISALKGGIINDETPREVLTRLDGIVTHAVGLLECTDPAAFVLVTPPDNRDVEEPGMIEITLRPIRNRTNCHGPSCERPNRDGTTLATTLSASPTEPEPATPEHADLKDAAA